MDTPAQDIRSVFNTSFSLVVEAKRVGVQLPHLIETIEAQWEALGQAPEIKRK